MTVLWTPYMPQSGITWRQSRIEPSRVAPRRLTGLRNTVARFRFRLPASAADAHCHPGLNPGRHDRPWELGGAGRGQGARSPVPPCRSARRARRRSGRRLPRNTNCLPAPGGSLVLRHETCAPTHPREARFDCERIRAPWREVVAVHSHSSYAVRSRLRTFANPNPTLSATISGNVACGGRRGARRGFGDRT